MMNERIKALLLNERNMFVNGVTESDNKIYIHGSEENLEKFAELIASDIVGAIRGLQLSAQEDGMLNVASTCDTIAELIEQDYGVKE